MTSPRFGAFAVVALLLTIASSSPCALAEQTYDPCAPVSQHPPPGLGIAGPGNRENVTAEREALRQHVAYQRFLDDGACGEALAARGDRSAARIRFRRAIDASDRFDEPAGALALDRAHLGAGLFRAGFFADAASVWAHALRTDFRNDAPPTVADVAFARGDARAECLAVARPDGTDGNPTFVDDGSYAALARAIDACRAGHLDEAIATLRGIGSTTSGFLDPLLLLGDLDALTGDATAARATWLALVSDAEPVPGGDFAMLASEQATAIRRLLPATRAAP